MQTKVSFDIGIATCECLEMQERAILGSSGIKVSRVCLGTMNFGNAAFGCDEPTALSIIDCYLDRGHNFIDTANVYAAGRSEEIVGKALKGRRDSALLATKGGGPLWPGPFEGNSRAALMSAVDASLRRLDTDYIDLDQLHRYDPLTPLEETLAALDELRRSGKIRFAGVSNWTAAQVVDAVRLAENNRWAPLVSLQQQYSILERTIEVELLSLCQKFAVGILAWSPLAGGLLAGRYQPDEAPLAGSRLGEATLFRTNATERSFAIIEAVRAEAEALAVSTARFSIAWSLQRQGLTSTIIGPRTLDQLWDCLAAEELEVPDEATKRVDALSRPVLLYPHNIGSV